MILQKNQKYWSLIDEKKEFRDERCRPRATLSKEKKYIPRCEYCDEGERNVATGFTKENKLICVGCTSWYGLSFAPLWARKEIPTLTYVDEKEEGDWVGL